MVVYFHRERKLETGDRDSVMGASAAEELKPEFDVFDPFPKDPVVSFIWKV